ncbi:TPA: hypothetical protein SMR81_003300 [Proteus mirabilis]|nr:hypothetical protein [Proteus mirabilis]HEK2145408.1 hypothetical protein [Proteus mirabilis]HEK2858122.1 hypothetical protein [Proteus mirabilis]
MSIFFNPAKHPHRLKPQPLGTQGEHYNEDWPMPELDFLETVDKQQCILVDKEIRRRDAFAFPGFITGIITFIMVFHFVFTEHNSKYIRFNKNLHDYTLEYKAQYEDKTQRDKLPSFILDKYAPYFNQEKLSILDYIHVYFGGHITSKPYQNTLFFLSTFIAPFFLISLGGYQSFFKKNPILVFNRERNLVYTWRKNKVFIARYPEIGIGKIGKTLTFQLFGLDKSKQTLVSELFFPNVYVYSVYNTSTDYHDQRFINFINTYMREGRDAIIPFDYHRKKPKVYFGKNPPPADFEQQVEQILAKLDQEKEHHA